MVKVEKLASDYIEYFRCPWCRKHGSPRKCDTQIVEKHDGFRCMGYRSEYDKRLWDLTNRRPSCSTS